MARPSPRIAALGGVLFLTTLCTLLLVELVLIQRFHLYLGHPVYSLAVVLVSILAFSSIGSALTHRLPDARLASWVGLASGLVLVAIL